jgi:hypothetical protein
MADKASSTRRSSQRKVDKYESLKAEIEAIRSEQGEDQVHGLREANK